MDWIAATCLFAVLFVVATFTYLTEARAHSKTRALLMQTMDAWDASNDEWKHVYSATLTEWRRGIGRIDDQLKAALPRLPKEH